MTCRPQSLGRYFEGQGHLEAKWYLAHNCSRILQLFHKKDHHTTMTCCAQHFDRYLEGQGHKVCMTLQQNHVRPITLLFEVPF